MEIELPESEKKGTLSIEEAIFRRRSCRHFVPDSITLKAVSQLLWAANGFRDREGLFRTAPSAGKTHPIFLYIVTGDNGVKGLDAGVYAYLPASHKLRLITRGDLRQELREASLKQAFIGIAPVSIVITAEYARTTRKYRERGLRYVHFEVGHVSENIYLQVLSLGLETVAVGSFIDYEVSKLLNLPEEHEPLYIMPVGYPER
ncbi:MAG: SagB-type dehydrogenase domain-containing protein [Candidatus Syntrophoarchaeum caldarius]|uniref:SagB-type dehydrogenase domain-containing protein n=1 Tax=Candidatus Syntropharchaeum caldarium TaxID=1838285 RepID=A0A1F2PBU4_9EURY|nr:MAG: SagB-type dehydrogenase domain-containing protein [Candidatus Syntrophoarchaeum caldarius]